MTMTTHKPKTEIPGWYTTREAAEILDITPRTVSIYYRRGLLRGRKIQRVLWFSEAEIARFKRNRRGPGNPNFKSQ